LLPQRPDTSNAPRPMFGALAIASSGLSAQRMRMEVIAQNLANAETTHTAQGGPYQRRIVNLEAVKPLDQSTTATTASSVDATGTAGATTATTSQQSTTQTASGQTNDTDVIGGVRVASVAEDKTPGALIYDPGHPDADKNGYVRMPNVSITDEMTDLMNARRLYEANATVFQVARAMLNKALDI
jgi:flagellar basal-body rod protein FlgC